MLGREQGTYQMGIFQLLDDLYLVELDVEVLVDALERAADLNIVFQLDRDLVVDERLEEAIPSGERMCQLPNVCVRMLLLCPVSCWDSAMHPPSSFDYLVLSFAVFHLRGFFGGVLSTGCRALGIGLQPHHP